MDYSFKLAAMYVLIYTQSCRQDTMGFAVQFVEYWVKQEIAQWNHHEWKL